MQPEQAQCEAQSKAEFPGSACEHRRDGQSERRQQPRHRAGIKHLSGIAGESGKISRIRKIGRRRKRVAHPKEDSDHRQCHATQEKSRRRQLEIPRSSSIVRAKELTNN